MNLSSSITSKLELAGDLEEWVTQNKAKVAAAIEAGVAEQAQKVLETAQQLCPVRTGTLKSSLETKLSGEYATVRCNAKIAWYAFLVHFGSIHNTPNPFLYQSADLHRAELVPAIKERIDNANQ